MENNLIDNLTDDEKLQFDEFKRVKKRKEAEGKIAKIECDLLSPYSDMATVRQACREGDRLGIGAVVVYPSLVKTCASFLGGDPKCALIAAISYPYGGDVTEIKAKAVKRAVKDGVDEVEVSAPAAAIKEGNFSYFKRECKKLKKAVKTRALRITFDVSLFNGQELLKACQTACSAGVNMIRLNGASSDTIMKVNALVKDKCGIKADGVENVLQFEETLDFGATCISAKSALELASIINAN